MTEHDEHPTWLKAWTADEPPLRPEESRYALEARQALTEHTLGAYERAKVLRELAIAVRRAALPRTAVLATRDDVDDFAYDETDLRPHQPDRRRRRWWQL